MRKTLTFLLCFLSTFIVAQNSPYINRVIEYRPAPGQHINRLFPSPKMSNTYEDALKFANNQLLSQNHSKLLGLGGYGGYVIVGFDHSVINIKGEYDLRTTGNNFYLANTDKSAMAEPGIIMVCQDLNKNGKPDDDEPWYELAGSEYNNPKTIHNYEITYYRPDPDKPKSDVRWTDNQGNEGVVKHIVFATQKTMYPLWIKEDKMTFKGTKLPGNVYNNELGYFLQESFEYGYADNNINEYDATTKTFKEPIEKTGVKIDWAVDSEGNPVELDYIDFVKIYTGQLQEAGPLGETSTELTGIGGVIDVHPNTILSSTSEVSKQNFHLYTVDNKLVIKGIKNIKSVDVFTISGIRVATSTQLQDLPSGVYIVKILTEDRKTYQSKIILTN